MDHQNSPLGRVVFILNQHASLARECEIRLVTSSRHLRERYRKAQGHASRWFVVTLLKVRLVGNGRAAVGRGRGDR